MTKNYNDDPDDAFELYDIQESLKYVATVCGYKDFESYDALLKGKYNISPLSAAKLTTNMMMELGGIIALSPVVARPTSAGETLRAVLLESMEKLNELRTMLVHVYDDDEGYEDVKIYKGSHPDEEDKKPTTPEKEDS